MSSAAVASRFGQRLAHTDKKYRDQALKKLTAYLSRRHAAWTPLEWDKLWKALFYCMWMSDKRPVQMELARSLARLVHKVPARQDALAFVRSFLRTMRREWHGLDGLRLDKFYDLVRQFVRESVALLAAHKFARAAVGEFVDALSAEVVSQRPNGLRMHLADLFLTEVHAAAGDAVDSRAFLLLLEPFFTLLGSEYDQTVFKRVRDLVFLPMLSDFLFGEAAKQAAEDKQKKSDDDTDGDGEEEAAPRGFPRVDLARVQHRIFAIAAAEDTAERNRAALYELHGKFAALTKVDSLKAAQEANEEEEEADEDEEMEAAPEAEAEAVDAPKKKKKKSKKRKQAEAEEQQQEQQQEEEEPAKAVEAAPPSKKQKKAKKQAAEEGVEAVEAAPPSKKAKKTKKQAEEEVEAPVEVAQEEATLEKKKKAKKAKKPAEEPAETPEKEVVPAADKGKKKKAKKSVEAEPVEEAEPVAKEVAKKSKKKKAAKEEKEAEAQPKKEKKAATEAKQATKEAAGEKEDKQKQKKKPAVVVKSGVKFQRCAACGGFGKNLVRAGKELCGHCERAGKSQKKAAGKKRKAEEQRAAEAEAASAAASAKKVTFGKNKALPHSLSVKRLKASAAKDAVPKAADIKGVLKASGTPPASAKKGKKHARKTAADFF